MSNRTHLLWLLIICLAVASLGCDQARGNFDKVHFGMSRADVEKAMGKPVKVEGDPAKPVAYLIYGGRQLVVQFHRDRVQVKQVGEGAAATAKAKPAQTK